MEVVNTVGRRKAAVARVFVKPGKGQITINRKELAAYFPLEILQFQVKQPLLATNTAENFDITINLDGGGIKGQAEAARLLAGSLYIQRAVDDDVSELACLGKFHNIDIIQRMRELGAHLFRTMDKCDTRLFDTEMAAGMDGIPNHLYALL